MKAVKIDRKDWAPGLDKLFANYRLFGPVKGDQFHHFKALDKGELPDFNFLNTPLSPKSIIYPQSELMFKYTLDEKQKDHHIMQEIDKDYSPLAVIGIRPCDAASFLLVRKNFDTPEYKDPYWIRPYEATTFVGLACSDPCSTCFCTTAGCGPFHEDGLDVLLVDAGDHFLARAVTSKGEDFLKAAGWDVEDDIRQIADLKKTAESKISSVAPTDKLKSKITTELYEGPFWEEVAFACINCGICTYVCPTCWCFDIQDETYRHSGFRMRNWDSCMYPLFTLHASRHNPRGTKLHRVRQRFMHKLKYYVDRYDTGIQCVGCGRCIRSCPVNIDIRKVCALMNDYEPALDAE
ncbi:MAG: 4Fe-4S dicluster domain-containing protein [Desulfobacteraceae bacterium]|nr:4Fe-4S dicluster domain-containing protein [Desulfobacteraceae bacterium]